MNSKYEGGSVVYRQLGRLKSGEALHDSIVRFLFLSFLLMSAAGAIQCQTVVAPAASCPEEQEASSFERTVNLLRAELYASAECSARRLVAHQPASADAHNLLGYILNRENRPAESLNEYTIGAKFRKPDSNNLAVVALDYALLRDYSDASKWLTQALEMNPSNAAYWYYLGRIHYNQNEFSRAVYASGKCLEFQPNNARALYNLGLTYEGLSEKDRAVELYRRAIDIQQKNSVQDAQPYYDLGSLLAKQNNATEALPLLRKAAQIEPRNPAVLEELARVEEMDGQLGLSLSDLKKAVFLRPDVSSLHFELGHVYQKLNMQREAKEQFEICSKIIGTRSTTGADSLDFSKPDLQE